MRTGFLGNEFRVSPVEFLLDENGADLFFFAKPDEPDELCRGRFFTVGFYGDLCKAVILCEVGECGMIDEESFGVQAVYERVDTVFRGLQVGQCLLQVPAELPGMCRVELAERGTDVLRDGLHVGR